MARQRTGQTSNRTRGFLYLLAKPRGDFQSGRTDRGGTRIAYRAAGRATGQGLQNFLQ